MNSIRQTKVKKIGLTVRHFRQMANHSQESLAETVGVTREQISRIERGKHEPKALLLLDIAKACSFSCDSIMADLDN